MKREGKREGQLKELDGGRVEEAGRSGREGAGGRNSGGRARQRARPDLRVRDAWWWQEGRK